MTRNQIWGGAFMILAGMASLLGNLVGFGNIWPLYPLVIGILMILIAREGESPRRRLARQTAGAWVALTGVVHSIAYFAGYVVIGPLYMIGGGLIMLWSHQTWNRIKEARQ